MSIRITAQKSYGDHFNVEKNFEEDKTKVSDAIKEVCQHAFICESRCLTKSSNFRGCYDIKYMITISVVEGDEPKDELIEIAEDLKLVLKIYGWTIF